MKTLIIVTIGAVMATLSTGQLTVPPRELGFVYKQGQADALVKIAAYLDLTCPDSQAAYPTLTTLADLYQRTDLQLKIYLFSLPYHRNSHTISKGANVINSYNSSNKATVFDYIKVVYNNIDRLSTAGSSSLNDAQVLEIVANLATSVTGIAAETFKNGVADEDIDTHTRLEWKYGCTRGVYGTPMFTVNDVFVNADATWTVTQWLKLVDGLLGKSRRLNRKH